MLASPTRLLSLCACILAFSGGQATAQTTFFWNAPSGGNWSAGADWLGNAVPPSSSSTILEFDSLGSTLGYSTTNNISNFTVNGLTFQSDPLATIGLSTSSGSLILAANGPTLPTLQQNGSGTA